MNAGASPERGESPGSIVVENSSLPVQVQEAVLFSFDDQSIPFSSGLKLDLLMGKKPGHANPIVVRQGQPGEPDSERVRYYGTVIEVGEELRMWYLGRGDKYDPSGGPLRLLYAVSKDGIHWEKPKLALIDYNGSKQNNLVDLMEGKYGLSESVVIYDPEDPDPARLFKLVFEAGKYGNRLAVAYSPDGLRWNESPKNPLGPVLEPSGLIRFNGYYYVNGQGGGYISAGLNRMMVTFASYDFEHWTQAGALSFHRAPITEYSLQQWNTLEEVHLGASLMGRGNVILGVYGMWHGVPSGDRSYVTMDLGLVVSNDGLHFREPIPGFKFLPSREELEVPLGRGPSLARGQGMVGIGDKTLYWYEAWGSGGVRLATWERDRFGYLRPFNNARDPHVVSCPMRFERAGARLFLNADGLSDNTQLTVELLGRDFQPLPGYSGEDCVPLRTSGFRQAVRWRNKETLEAFSLPTHLRVKFEGVRPEDAKLYAIYVASE